MIDGAGAAIANWRSSTKPDEPAETELRTFHAAFVDQTSGGAGGSAAGLRGWISAIWLPVNSKFC